MDTDTRASFEFEIIARCPQTRARAGVLHTPHGDIPTPAFAPVGTYGTVKTVSPRELTELNASVLMVNSYHLYLRPGHETISDLGGLHRFMGWDGPLMTDSGGFQIFSLAELRSVEDDGVRFQSHLDGSEHFFTPEKAVAVQETVGADLIMALDECPPYPSGRKQTRQAMDRTHRWAERCLAAQMREDQALFGIVQGGTFPDLRGDSAEFLASLDFPGYAIGGLSVGEPKELMHDMLDVCVPRLPDDKPRHLLGVGAPDDLFEGTARGVDLFDCVLPTRMARTGTALTHDGRINLRNAQYADEDEPIENDCACYACQSFSRGYLRHLVHSKEILGLHLVTLHNLHCTLSLMEEIREAVIAGEFTSIRPSPAQEEKART